MKKISFTLFLLFQFCIVTNAFSIPLTIEGDYIKITNQLELLLLTITTSKLAQELMYNELTNSAAFDEKQLEIAERELNDLKLAFENPANNYKGHKFIYNSKTTECISVASNGSGIFCNVSGSLKIVKWRYIPNNILVITAPDFALEKLNTFKECRDFFKQTLNEKPPQTENLLVQKKMLMRLYELLFAKLPWDWQFNFEMKYFFNSDADNFTINTNMFSKELTANPNTNQLQFLIEKEKKLCQIINSEIVLPTHQERKVFLNIYFGETENEVKEKLKNNHLINSFGPDYNIKYTTELAGNVYEIKPYFYKGKLYGMYFESEKSEHDIINKKKWETLVNIISQKYGEKEGRFINQSELDKGVALITHKWVIGSKKILIKLGKKLFDSELCYSSLYITYIPYEQKVKAAEKQKIEQLKEKVSNFF